MLKRFFFIFILLIAIGGVFAWFYIQKNQPIPNTPFKAIPTDASLIIEIRNYSNFRQSMIEACDESPSILKIPLFASIEKTFHQIDTLGIISLLINDLVSQSYPMVISGHMLANEDLDWCYYFTAPEEKSFRYIDRIIEEKCEGLFLFNTRKYENFTISKVVFNETESVSYSWAQGVFIVSKSSLLVEEAIRQVISTDNILTQKNLSEAVNMAGENALLSIYLNCERLPLLLENSIATDYKEQIRFTRSLGGWIELDLNRKHNLLIFNGYTTKSISKSALNNLFLNQKPVHLDIFNKIPTCANTFAIFGISDLNKYMIDYNTFGNSSMEKTENYDKLKKLEDEYEIDLETGFQNIFEYEAGVVFANFSNDTLTTQSFTLIKINNRDDAEKTILRFITNYANQKDLKANEFILESKDKENVITKIWSLPFGNIPSLLFGQMFTASDNCYCTFLDNYLLFGNDPEALLKYIEQINEKHNLSNDKQFSTFSEYFSSETNFFFYNKPILSNDFYSKYISSETANVLKLFSSFSSTINAIVYQFNIDDNNLIYNNLFVNYSSSEKQKKDTTNNTKKTILQVADDDKVNEESEPNQYIWKTTLDEQPTTKPLIIKNSTANDEEYFVSDSKNNLYLLSNEGKIIWKKQISEPIVSEIFLIDAFRNGKQQLLFNTKQKIYLFDRKGNIVEGYPITLKSNATNGLSVFDYDRNRNYRILVACSDRNIYAYDNKGNEVKGWKPKKTASEIEQPIQFFSIQNKDFITFFDKSNVYFVDRKGKSIFKEIQNCNPSKNTQLSLINSRSLKEARFVFTNIEGKIHLITTNGATSTFDYGKFNKTHWFRSMDINDDGLKEFVYVYDNTIKVISQTNQLLWVFNTNSPITQTPQFVENKNVKYKVVVTTDKDSKTYVIDGFGMQYNKTQLSNFCTQFLIEISNNQEKTLYLLGGIKSNCIVKTTIN